MPIYVGAAVSLTFFMAVGWFTATFLQLEGPMFALFFGMMSTLGITASAFFYWMQAKHAARKAAKDEGAASEASGPAGSAPAAAGSGEVDVVVRDADNRLAASQLAQGSRIGNLPAVFLIGEPGSAKTSTMVSSGLEPELLAGNVYQDNAIAPTRGVNLWFARQTAFVEPGGRFMSDSQSWTNLLKRLAPGKLRGSGGGTQAPRLAVLCFDCEEFTKPGAADAVTLQARKLQARLGEVSQTLGISFPVYVLFTKIDRVPFLLDFVRNLSSEEGTQVFGTTLPMRSPESTGVYGEEETRRLAAAFDTLFYSLCDKRLDYLPRENDQEKLPGAYEFPREFRKLRTTLVQFLVDVCRPSQLRASPFLRGFYFSGVRPVVVSDIAATPVPAAQQHSKVDAGATRMFSVASVQGDPQQSVFAAQAVGTKRVPQWMFLSHLFNDVILVDRAAMGASGSTTKTSGLKRGLLIATALLSLIFTFIFSWSYFGNRRLERNAITAAEAISSGEASGGSLPSVDSLKRLETLRQSLDELTRYRQRTPLGLRWGLYAGDDMYPHVRRIYYNRFHQLLFGQTQAGILAYLQRLPGAPGPVDPYDPPYNSLKAYLITTSHHDKSTKPFLAPFLMNQWSAGRNNIGDERMKLAQLQFDFYSEDLRTENPYSSENDGAAVDRARRYLSQFTGYERVYNFMITEASSKNKPVNFNRDFPGSAAVVTNNREIAGAFTRTGWAYMQDAVKHADRFFSGERWVLGDYSQTKPDMAKLEQELRDKYTSDYIRKWREFMKASRVNTYANLKDAAEKLTTISASESPLLALFWVATRNTAVDSPKVKQAFDSVHAVVAPPAETMVYISDKTERYVTSLADLQRGVDQVVNAIPPDPSLANQTMQQAVAAKQVTKQMAGRFIIDQEAKLHADVHKLLDDPITHAEGYLRGTGVADLNAGGQALCMPFGAMTRKFPFNPTAQAEATLEEVNSLLLPGTGKLWVLYEEKFKKVLQEQGGQYVVNPAAGVNVDPRFVTFFNQAARFSKALYSGGATEPKLLYTLQPVRSDQIQSLVLNIDGRSLKYPGQNSQQFVWPGTTIREANLKLKIAGGSDLDVAGEQGLWAVFHFFADADGLAASGSGYNLHWIVRSGRGGKPMEVKGAPLTYRFYLDTAGAPPVFYKDWLMSLRCVAQVAR